MPESDFALPVISITPYLSSASDPEAKQLRAKTSTALHEACIRYGFFYLDISSFVDQSETDELTRLGREFFSLPQEEKDKLSLKNEDNARGYARLHENITLGKTDNHEGIDFFRPVDEPDKAKPLWGSNQWPSIPGFRDKYEMWIAKMKRLGFIVMEAMAAGLGSTHEEWIDLRSKVDDGFWGMRIIGYPSLPEEHDGISCGAHKDYGCLTFLYADSTRSALQVYLRHDRDVAHVSNQAETQGKYLRGTWINADPIPGCLVCNIGEMWEIWTNGLYKSTLHRVIHRGANYRVSVPFFFEPNFTALVEPLPAVLRLMDNKGKNADERIVPPKKYEPVIYGEFLAKKVGNNFVTGKYA